MDADGNDSQSMTPFAGVTIGHDSARVANGQQVAGFVSKLLSMVLDNSITRIIHLKGENAFEIVDPPRFAREVLPKFFKHNNLASFIRQLNLYGFKKVTAPGNHDTGDRLEFQHEHFRRNKPDELAKIERRKNVAVAHASTGADKLEKEIGEIQQDQSVIVEAIHQLSEESRIMREALVETSRRQDEQQRTLCKVMELLVEQVPTLRDTLSSAYTMLSQSAQDNQLKAADILTGSLRQARAQPSIDKIKSKGQASAPPPPATSRRRNHSRARGNKRVDNDENDEDVTPEGENVTSNGESAVEVDGVVTHVKRERLSPVPMPIQIMSDNMNRTGMMIPFEQDEAFGGCNIMIKATMGMGMPDPYNMCMTIPDEPDAGVGGGGYPAYFSAAAPTFKRSRSNNIASEEGTNGQGAGVMPPDNGFGCAVHARLSQPAMWNDNENNDDDRHGTGNIMLCC